MMIFLATHSPVSNVAQSAGGLFALFVQDLYESKRPSQARSVAKAMLASVQRFTFLSRPNKDAQ